MNPSLERACRFALAIGGLSLPACDESVLARTSLRDSGIARDAPSSAPFVVPDANGTGHTLPRDCHVLRFHLGNDGSSCVFHIPEAIQFPDDVQVLVSSDAGGHFFRRKTEATCDADGWYWLDEPPSGATVAFCSEACRGMQTSGIDFIDFRIRCLSGDPMR
jgi:hypothetical protein